MLRTRPLPLLVGELAELCGQGPACVSQGAWGRHVSSTAGAALTQDLSEPDGHSRCDPPTETAPEPRRLIAPQGHRTTLVLRPGASSQRGPSMVHCPWAGTQPAACLHLGPNPALSFLAPWATMGRAWARKLFPRPCPSLSPQHGARREVGCGGVPRGVWHGQARGYLSSWTQCWSWCCCVSVASCPGDLGHRSSGCSCFPSLQRGQWCSGPGCPSLPVSPGPRGLRVGWWW